MRDKISHLNCKNKELDENLEELNNQRRKQEKENDEMIDEKVKEKTEYLAKISTLEQNLKQIRIDKMDKSRNILSTTVYYLFLNLEM